MKKFLRVTLKVFLSILGLLVVLAIIAAIYVNKNFLNIDKKDKYRKIEIKELTSDGYTFRDLNRNGALDIYEDARQPAEARVNDLLSQMTLEEKIRILKGSGMGSGIGYGPKDGIPGAVGTIVPIPRLGIPTIYLSDGPAGLRISTFGKNNDSPYYCTAFPIGTLLASTWNTELVEQVGEAMGNETLEYGIDVILGPGANIHRNPLCGRNFEYYSEDPVITGNIGAAMVNGIESNGVGTSVKHFVANNQETNRNDNNAIISDRAMREIYLKGFEIIVKKAQPWTIMSSYNLVNGTHVSASKDLLTDILRNEWGFQGLVMTDWYGGTNPPVELSAGNDLFEPGTRKQYKTLLKAAENSELPEEDIDRSVKRILQLIINSKKMEGYKYSNKPDLEAHAQVTRQSASEGMVLLKNEETLPLKGIKNVALFGITSFDFIAGGTGSGDVNEAYTVSLEEGLKNTGYEIVASTKEAFEAHKSANEKAFEKREGLAAMMNTERPPELIPSDELLTACVNDADIAIVTIGRNSGEGKDRVKENDFDLSEDEHEMIEKVCKNFHGAGKKVVVVLNIGGVIETASWKEKPDAILLAWQGGQEGGNSVADILKGTVNPSGKLPMTFPIALEDHASSKNFPMAGESMNMNSMFSGKKEKTESELVPNKDYTNYEEGIYVGYRYFDKNNIEVSYPFGYGLSYTSFEYENMETEVADGIINVQVSVKNTGDLAGKDVVEVYTSKPETAIDRPAQELKAFAKTPILNPGESVELSMSIPIKDLSYWNEETSAWTLEKGIYRICAAASSRDKKLSKEISL
jgi:beta-glucosidase